jgi:hypothetical protein
MKYTAKHPDRAAYDLSREEMVSPQVIQELLINDEWIVRVGQRWVPMKEFLTGAVAESVESLPDPSAGDAAWTPMTVFSLILRVTGLFVLGWFWLWLLGSAQPAHVCQ